MGKLIFEGRKCSFVAKQPFFLLNIFCIKVTMIDCALEAGNLSDGSCKLVHLIFFGNRLSKVLKNSYSSFDPNNLLLRIYPEIILKFRGSFIY